MQSRLTRFFENFILFAIVLVLIQTFLEDYAVLAGWSWEIRRILIITGFAFDLMFTAEFFARGISAISKGEFGRYFMEQRGWIDFLASIPLLLFNSGPELFALITGSGAVLAFGSLLNILKVVKAIRIARVLRLLRVLKIFRRIKNADSVMAQRHVARIATMAVSTLVLTLLLFAVVEGFLTAPDVDLLYQESAVQIIEYIESGNYASGARNGELARFAQAVPIILQVRQDGHIRYDALGDGEILAPSDYGYVAEGDLEVYMDLRHLNAEEAIVNLRYFFLIIALVLMLMFLYSPHFALTISDPIHVMRKGFDEAGYNLEVRIPEEFKSDEVYRLAASYNLNYLPLKDRESADGSSTVLNLSMDDFADIGGLDGEMDFPQLDDSGEDLVGIADVSGRDVPEEVPSFDDDLEDSGLSLDEDFEFGSETEENSFDTAETLETDESLELELDESFGSDDPPAKDEPFDIDESFDIDEPMDFDDSAVGGDSLDIDESDLDFDLDPADLDLDSTAPSPDSDIFEDDVSQSDDSLSDELDLEEMDLDDFSFDDEEETDKS
jgi:hypothetical protein